MKRSKNIHNEIWVKRIWTQKDEYDYIKRTLEQFERALIDINHKTTLNQPVHMILEKAPWWYSAYKISIPYVTDWSKFVIGASVGALITVIIERFFDK